MSSVNEWDPKSYDSKLAFVSEYGKNLIQLLGPKKHERILDLGCGTGDLTHQISQSGAIVTGIDYSPAMIEAAQTKYPELSFQVSNGENFAVNLAYDAVFSNAALHWMKDAKAVIHSVHTALKTGGRFVAEFGGKGNVHTIIQAIYEVMEREFHLVASELNPWYFPSIGEYTSLLEAQGFKVEYARLYERPTRLTDGEEGLTHWLANFGGDFFSRFSESEQMDINRRVQDKLKPLLRRKDGSFYADYVRLAIVALKTA